jgi:hypothetical protein
MFETVGIRSPFVLAAALVAVAAVLATRIPAPVRPTALHDDAALAAGDAAV